jgi:hypothetical protein
MCMCLYMHVQHAMRLRVVSYFQLWLLWLYLIFPNYLIKDTVFGKDVLIIKCVPWCSLQLLSEILLSLRRLEQVTNINVYILHDVKYPFILDKFYLKLQFSRRNFTLYAPCIILQCVD